MITMSYKDEHRNESHSRLGDVNVLFQSKRTIRVLTDVWAIILNCGIEVTRKRETESAEYGY